MYRKIPSSVKNSACKALSLSSLPTCGPPSSSCATCARLSISWSAVSRRARIAVALCCGSGGRRIAMSRAEPKFCTCGSRKPAAASRVRTVSTLTAPGKLTSALTPPVKSMARFSPRVKNAVSDTTMNSADSAYHQRRVAMNGKLVWWLKNSTAGPWSDRQPRELAPAAVHECQQRAAAHQRGEHRGRDAERQHHGKTADRAGAEHPQHHPGDERRDVGIGNGRESLLEAGADGGLWRDALAQLLADALVDQHVGIHRHADGEDDAGDARQRQ